MMKKIMLLLCLMLIPGLVNAECSYKSKKEFNDLASYVTYTYDFNESNKTFSVEVNNINDKLYVVYNKSDYIPVSNSVIINGFLDGTNVTIDIFSKNLDECVSENVRTISFTLPYINPYYLSLSCENHMDLEVCNSELLSYKLSYKVFLNLLNKDTNISEENDVTDIVSEEEDIEEKESIIWIFLKEHYIKIIVAIVSAFITYSIGKVSLRKTKHKI